MDFYITPPKKTKQPAEEKNPTKKEDSPNKPKDPAKEDSTIKPKESEREESFSIMTIVGLAILFFMSLISFAVSSTTFIDISDFTLGSCLNDSIKREGKGYTYGRVAQDNIVFDFSEFTYRFRIDDSDYLSFSDTFLHSAPEEDYQPFATANESYTKQLSPDIVMTYNRLDENYYNFALVSGNEIKQIWTQDIYITQPLADQLLGVDSSLKASYDAYVKEGKNGYLVFQDYILRGMVHYDNRWVADLTVKDVITSESLGHFSDIGGGAFIYCSFDASQWCFGKPQVEFFLYGNQISMTNYMRCIFDAMNVYDEGVLELELYSWNNGQFVLNDLMQRYADTKAYYASGSGQILSVLFGIVGIVCFVIFTYVSLTLFGRDKTFLETAPFILILVFLITALMIVELMLIPNIILDGVVLCFGNYLSIPVVFIIGLLEAFILAIVSSYIKKEKKKNDEKDLLTEGDAL